MPWPDARLRIAPGIAIPPEEIELTATRARGPGGQNVNKVSSAVHLRFDVRGSSLPDDYKRRLLSRADRRLTREGVIVIKAQESRSLEQNREAALARLAALIREATAVRKVRRPTRPTRGSQRRRLAGKKLRGKTKSLRRPPESE